MHVEKLVIMSLVMQLSVQVLVATTREENTDKINVTNVIYNLVYPFFYLRGNDRVCLQLEDYNMQ